MDQDAHCEIRIGLLQALSTSTSRSGYPSPSPPGVQQSWVHPVPDFKTLHRRWEENLKRARARAPITVPKVTISSHLTSGLTRDLVDLTRESIQKFSVDAGLSYKKEDIEQQEAEKTR